MSAATFDTAKDVRPEMVDTTTFGHHESKVVSGRRYWEFESEAAAELFVTYANRGEFRLKKG